MHASHVVVDTIDGYEFRNDASGQLFDSERAHAFADERNRERKPGHATYQVFSLTPEHTPAYDDSHIGRKA